MRTRMAIGYGGWALGAAGFPWHRARATADRCRFPSLFAFASARHAATSGTRPVPEAAPHPQALSPRRVHNYDTRIRLDVARRPVRYVKGVIGHRPSLQTCFKWISIHQFRLFGQLCPPMFPGRFDASTTVHYVLGNVHRRQETVSPATKAHCYPGQGKGSDNQS